ncbi:HAD family hydrolase [Streptomyces sp. CB00072]|uniref:HAD family hydrolase n=1 Tax=Streptomyces sp. CB00072 TaxID=1703928 RepID=UPI00093F0961|nr:HAD family hydrolase [Streptomyces sp. CB00072]
MRTIIFDVDDTLLHTHETAFRKSVLTAQTLGLDPPSAQEFHDMFGRVAFDDCLQVWHPQVTAERYSRVYDSLTERVPYQPISGARSTLEALSDGGTTVAVLTNGPGHKTIRKLAALGVAEQRFAFIRHADNARHLKPRPEAFLDLVADYAVDPRETAYVSDFPDDGIGARAAGFGFIGVLTGLWSASDFLATGTAEALILESLRDITQGVSQL